MAQEQPLINEKVRSLIGKDTKTETAWSAVTRTEIRRFTQAIMDDDPLYYDDDYAKKTRFGGVVAPPTLPTVLFGMREPGSWDPLVDMPDDFGGDKPSEMADKKLPNWTMGVHEILAQLPETCRHFDGGNDLEIYQLARPDDKITCTGKLVKVYEKTGRTGRLGFVVVDLTYRNQKGELLYINHHTEVVRESTKENKS